MLKKSAITKISLAGLCLLTLFLIYLFPKDSIENNIIPETNYTVTSSYDTVYLIDKSDYVSRVNISLSSTTIEDQALEIISYMTDGTSESSLIPNGFKTIIPKNTEVLDYLLEDGNFKVNFSTEFLNISEEDEVKLIEALVYSLTSLDDISSITILVDGTILNRLPNSNELLPNPITRSYGINKKYDISSVKDTTKTTIYYLSKYNDYYYYVPVTKVSNTSEEKIEIIIKELTSSPIYETSLMSYLNSETTLESYTAEETSLRMDFNNAILSDITSKDILEEVTYAINLSIKDNYELDEVVYYVDSEIVATFDLKSLE